MVTQITPINLIPGTMIPRVNISQYDTGARVLKFQVYNGDSLFTFTNAMSVALVGTKPDGKGFSYTGTIASNMPTFDVTAQMSAVAGKVRAELVVFESGKRCGSGNFVIFVEEGALGDGTDMSDSDYAIINDALEAAFDLDHFYADLQNMVTEAVEDIHVIQGQTVIDPTLTVSGAAADAKATGDMARNFLEALMTETTTEASIASIDDGAGGLPLKQFVGNIQPAQAGEGDPSPDNVRAISGYTGVMVSRTGKNILPNIDASVTHRGVTYTPNSDGSIKMSGTATGGQSFLNIATITLKDGEYVFSVGTNVTGFVLENGRYHNLSNGSVTFSIDGTSSAVVRVTVANGTMVDTTIYPMIRRSSDTSDTYEPYTGATYAVNFPTAAGTVYGGTLIVNSDGSGTLTVDRTLRTLNGGESYSANGQGGYTLFNLLPPAETNYKTICNRFVETTLATTAPMGYMLGNNNRHLYFVNVNNIDGVSDVATWKEWLASNNVEIIIPLATPTTYALSAVEVVQMLQGVNNIWADAAGTLSAEYYANTALYVEKKIAELQALVLENQ